MTRGRPRDPGTDTAILRAAAEVFVERGVEGASIEQIAKRAGVGKVTVYRRWSTKEELLAQAVEVLVADQVSRPSAELVATGSPYELVENALDSMAETAGSPEFRALAARVLGSAVSHPELMAVYWTHYIRPRRELTRALLRRAQEEGTVAADADLDALTDMIAGAVTYRALQPDPPDAEGMRAYLRAVFRQAGLLR
ncbi:TetR/AcrR family transcriptional regulator [Amycolatopsis sp. 195334CR]|uniref:TetR/AcrR family transcriptional regulator n=1 Tax=Amycolatopsis sp. 195334CR TaxID=2814588 RepID=UPI001A8CBA70|nr:TetR/AcrR family transcriptional regulator [Amycolatopsis sp. 195334CR]MBN6038215.1 TetR/AcrR family transcriptional regulator [Amycolatopsis sp. 195334CR]